MIGKIEECSKKCDISKYKVSMCIRGIALITSLESGITE